MRIGGIVLAAALLVSTSAVSPHEEGGHGRSRGNPHGNGGEGLSGTSYAEGSKRVTFHAQLDTRTAYAGAWGYAASGREYALVGERYGTMFVDVTDPNQPVEVAFVPGPQSVWREVKTWDHYAYIVSEGTSAGKGLQIVDLAGLPASVSHVATYTDTFATAHTLWIDERGYLYASGTRTKTGITSGMRILSLADPVLPVEAGAYTTRYVHDIYVRNGVGYAAEIGDGLVTILDLADPAAPAVISSFHTPKTVTHNTWLSGDGLVLGTSDETPGGFLTLYDVSNPASPVETARFREPNNGSNYSLVHNVRMIGDLAVVSWYFDGFRLLDISDPTLPVEVGFYDTFEGTVAGYNGNWDVYPLLPSGTILASDISNGLIVASFTGEYGILTGAVLDAVTGLPVEGATVQVLESGSAARSGPDGRYAVDGDPGPVTLGAVAFGYHAALVQASSVKGARTPVDILLNPVPSGSVSGAVLGPGGAGVEGVEVTLSGTPLATTTAPDGSYSFPVVPRGGYTIVASSFGFTPVSAGLGLPPYAAASLDLALSPAAVAEEMESDPGWTIGEPSDTATGGIWTRDDPVGSGGGVVQPPDDHTPAPGVSAFVTGQATPGAGIGASDVDGGSTTLTTPEYDLSGLAHPVVSYCRWYVNDAGYNPGTDTWRVEGLGSQGGSWTALESTTRSTGAWTQVDLPLAALASGQGPPASARIRFVASDEPGESIVEAAVDDFQIVDSCDAKALPGLPDHDADGTENSCDPCPDDPLDDADRDGLCGDADNAPLKYNPSQADADGDGAGDPWDNCPSAPNPLQENIDGDFTGDACDADDDGDWIPDLADPDADGDGALDAADVCPGVRDIDQHDLDGDGAGDACDPDDGLVGGLRLLQGTGGRTELRWNAEAGAEGYHVYRGVLDGPASVAEARCYLANLDETHTGDTDPVPPGSGVVYLVTAVVAGSERSPGFAGDGSARVLLDRCR